MRELGERRGGYISIPIIEMDDEKLGIGVFGLPAYVQQYIGWVTQEVDGEKPPTASPEVSEWMVKKSKSMLGNTKAETIALIRYMEQHPNETANYFERVWGLQMDAKGFTDPFRLKGIRGAIPILSF